MQTLQEYKSNFSFVSCTSLVSLS